MIISREKLNNTNILSSNQFSPLQLIQINLIAIPDNLSSAIYNNLQHVSNRDQLFPYREGLYHVSQVLFRLRFISMTISLSHPTCLFPFFLSFFCLSFDDLVWSICCL